MYRSVATAPTQGGMPTDSGESVVTLDQVPRWSDVEHRSSSVHEGEGSSSPNPHFSDPLTSSAAAEGGGDGGDHGVKARFPVDHQINSKIYMWRGHPWNLEVDAVVNSTNEVRAPLLVLLKWIAFFSLR